MSDVRTVDILNEGDALAIGWSDGATTRFHAIWLRDNALDEATRSPSNGQRLIGVGDIPETTRIERAGIVDGQVELSFAPEEKSVRYPAGWLHANAYDREVEKPQSLLPRCVESFDGGLGPEDVTSDFAVVIEEDTALRDWLGHVRRFGFAKLTGGPASSGALLEVVDRFGYVRETNYGRWFEVRTEIDPTNLAFTGLGLQAHTDNPYRDPVPTLQILYCLENAALGGDSQVVDGFHAAERLFDEDPSAFALLSRHAAHFAYRGQGGVNLVAEKPMIELGVDGRLAAVRFNNRSAAPITAVPYAEMPAYYAAYRRFSEIIDDPAMAVGFKLGPGDCFIVDNTRVLHGRDGYEQEAGSRWLQGCYADKDGLISTLLALEHRMKEAADDPA